MKSFIVFVTAVLLTVSVQAQIYKHVDENGNVTFTDKPPEDATLVNVGRTNIVPPPDMPTAASDGRAGETTIEELAPPERYSVNIVAPMEDAVIPHGPGDFTVTVTLSPQLYETDMMQLFVDGDPIGEPQQQTSWGLTNISRGTHSLETRIINRRGKVKGRSPSVRVHVFRPIKQ